MAAAACLHLIVMQQKQSDRLNVQYGGTVTSINGTSANCGFQMVLEKLEELSVDIWSIH